MSKRILVKGLALVLCLMTILTLFTGCGGSLPGKWIIKDKTQLETGQAYRYLPSEMEFFSSGDGTFNIPYYRGAEEITWTAENGRLKVSCTMVFDYTYDYSIDGTELTLTYQDMTAVYVLK